GRPGQHRPHEEQHGGAHEAKQPHPCPECCSFSHCVPRKCCGTGGPQRPHLLCGQVLAPVLNITWLKNNEVVSEGVEETDFYPSVDNTFCKFSYLPFVPQQEDIYICQVEHWGTPEGKMEKIWLSKVPSPIPETMKNVLGALGLAFDILSIISGTIIFFKAMRINGHRGLL
uniref:Ig-like domain-containing protein n=1 Tax=Podarcis muralis TaxID=64176 RepID=A0A670JPW8_PODMU